MTMTEADTQDTTLAAPDSDGQGAQDSPTPDNADAPEQPTPTDGADDAGNQQEPPASIDDLMAQNTSLQENITKLENDLRSERNRPNFRMLEKDVQELREDLAANTRTITAFMHSVAPSEDADRIEGEVVQDRAARDFNRAYLGFWEQLHETANDGDGNQIVDIKTDPSFADFRTRWDKAFAARDRAGLASLVAESERTVRSLERSRLLESKEQARQEGEEAGRRRRQRAEETDLTGVRASGGPGTTDQELVNRLGAGEPMTTAEMAKARDAMERGVTTKLTS